MSILGRSIFDTISKVPQINPLYLILGWIAYGNFMAGLKTALLSMPIIAAALLTGMVPLVGPFIYYYLTNAWLMPLFPEFKLEYTWATTIIFQIGMVASVILNVMVSIFIIEHIRSSIKCKIS